MDDLDKTEGRVENIEHKIRIFWWKILMIMFWLTKIKILQKKQFSSFPIFKNIVSSTKIFYSVFYVQALLSWKVNPHLGWKSIWLNYLDGWYFWIWRTRKQKKGIKILLLSLLLVCLDRLFNFAEIVNYGNSELWNEKFVLLFLFKIA